MSSNPCTAVSTTETHWLMPGEIEVSATLYRRDCLAFIVQVRSTISATLVGSSPYHSLNGFTNLKVPNPQERNKHEKGIPLREFTPQASSILSVLVPNLPIRPWGRIEEWAFQKISVHGV